MTRPEVGIQSAGKDSSAVVNVVKAGLRPLCIIYGNRIKSRE